VSQYNTQVVAVVNTILQEKFEVTQNALLPEASLKEDLKLDSLDFVDMFIMLEQEMGKSVQNIDFMKIRTLGDIYQLVTDLNIEKPVG
jgi:acyl carrier protein